MVSSWRVKNSKKNASASCQFPKDENAKKSFSNNRCSESNESGLFTLTLAITPPAHLIYQTTEVWSKIQCELAGPFTGQVFLVTSLPEQRSNCHSCVKK